MKEYVIDFAKHLSQALEIGNSANLTKTNKKIENVVISGLGGSGIGGTIVSQLVADKITTPIYVNKEYDIPAFVGKNTLFIASSYSGNTEETLEALSKAVLKGAEIAVITSGGKLLKEAKEKGYNYIQIPEGFPPRAAFGLSFPQLFFILESYDLTSNSFKTEINKAIKNIDNNKEAIVSEATEVAKKLFDKTPAIYSVAKFEGVAIRFRQQINENSKMLCWHHVIPEMNHNELVGWAGGDKKIAVVILRNESDYQRNQARIEINKEIFAKYTDSITEIYSKGDTDLERALYHIHLEDWISVFLAEIKKVDPIEVDVIDFLKGSLAKS